jgi:hypothetical protein
MKWLLIGLVGVVLIGATVWLGMRAPYVTEVPPGAPPINGDLRTMVRGRVVKAKDGEADYDGHKFKVEGVIDWASGRGWSGSGEPLPAAELARLKAIEPEAKSKAGTSIVIRGNGMNLGMRMLLTGGFSGATGTGMSGNDKYMVFYTNAAMKSKASIRMVVCDPVKERRVAYVLPKKRGYSQGFQWALRFQDPPPGAPPSKVFKAGIKYICPPEIKGFAMRLVPEQEYRWMQEEPWMQLGFQEGHTATTETGVEDDFDNGVYWVWLATPIDFIDFELVKKP